MRGSPSSNTTSALSLWDHPRACGAHPIDLNDAEFTVGSSPRMRGSLKEVDRDHNLIGIIPAHAGLTESVKLVHARRWDHPRACGAHKLDEVLCKRLKGSSPRMRGSPQMCRVWRGWHGIIPAHAGLTGELRPVQIYGWDHPRACGAHMFAKGIIDSDMGSSPRMRGSLLDSPPI